MAVLSEEDEKEFILRRKDAHMPHMLSKFRIEMNVQKISEALTIFPEMVIKMFRDGRKASGVMECKSADIYEYLIPDNTNLKVDGFYPINSALTSNLTIGVRCLTSSGVSFTQAAFAQDTSNWKPMHVFLSQRVLTFQVVADIVNYPIVYFTSCLPQDIIYYTTAGTFKKSVCRRDYYKTIFGKSLNELIKNNEFIDFNIYE